MIADLLVTGIAQLVTPRGTGAARGAAMRELEIIDDAAIAILDGRITWVGRRDAWQAIARVDLDLGGRAVLPGLVDPHTHAIWAGDRLADFEARADGVGYEQILAQGGGIRSTIAATAAGSAATLAVLAVPRIRALLTSGATTIEVKSGYGFTAAADIASLDAIGMIARTTAATLVPTLLVHVPPRESAERAGYVDVIVRGLLPQLVGRDPAPAVDIFIERESFTVAEARTVLGAARALGLHVKAHADQFHAIGGVELAIEMGALSVDHLEASGPDQVRALAASRTTGVILPGVTLHLGLPAAPARALIDAGGAVAVGTDLNPGSSPVFSTQLALALAVRINRLTPAEALTAATANAGAALGLTDVGRLQVGQRADFLVLAGRDWRDIAYSLGGTPVERIFIAGREVSP